MNDPILRESPATIAGYVLAGGRSTRMGSDKRALIVGGEALLVRALAVAGPGATVVAKERPDGLPEDARFVRETDERFAPIFGIAAALDDACSRGLEWILALAVDVPLLRRATILELARRTAGVPADCRAILPLADGRHQPLAAFFRVSIRSELANRLAGGDPSLERWILSGPHLLVAAGELGAADDEFLNVNTPDDARRVEWALAAPVAERKDAK